MTIPAITPGVKISSFGSFIAPKVWILVLFTGCAVEMGVGWRVFVGPDEGNVEGETVGVLDGWTEGWLLGWHDGCDDGWLLGWHDGCEDGCLITILQY